MWVMDGMPERRMRTSWADGAGLDPRVTFEVAGTGSLPRREGGCDAVISDLAFNFFPDPGPAMEEQRSAVCPVAGSGPSSGTMGKARNSSGTFGTPPLRSSQRRLRTPPGVRTRCWRFHLGNVPYNGFAPLHPFSPLRRPAHRLHPPFLGSGPLFSSPCG